MRPEISNKLLLQVIQAWNPEEADLWYEDTDGKLRWIHQGESYHYYVRHSDGGVLSTCDDTPQNLVKFLLKDRPKLHCKWDPLVLRKAEKVFGTSWTADPFVGIGYEPNAKTIVSRLKSYEYLKEWKESQEGYMKPETPSVAGTTVFFPNGPKTIADFTGGEPTQQLSIHTAYPITIVSDVQIRLKGSVNFDMKPGETLSLVDCGGVWCETSRATTINPSDVTLTIGGQTIERMPVEMVSIRTEVPTTYQKICPHCNGSKEVTGWLGKEPCNAC